MKFLNYIKEKIMPRPKGAKNKATLEREAAKEFDYERDDEMFDNAYQTVPRESGVAVPAWTMEVNEAAATASPPTTTAMINTPVAGLSYPTTLYLVEGEVQMTPREMGRGPVVAKQFRLVSAMTEEQAVHKFSSYFVGLSDSDASYSVRRAAAMETIN
jgi:hypothetical protein